MQIKYWRKHDKERQTKRSNHVRLYNFKENFKVVLSNTYTRVHIYWPHCSCTQLQNDTHSKKCKSSQQCFGKWSAHRKHENSRALSTNHCTAHCCGCHCGWLCWGVKKRLVEITKNDHLLFLRSQVMLYVNILKFLSTNHIRRNGMTNSVTKKSLSVCVCATRYDMIVVQTVYSSLAISMVLPILYFITCWATFTRAPIVSLFSLKMNNAYITYFSQSAVALTFTQ